MPSVTISMTGLDALQRLQQFASAELFEKAKRGGVAYAAKAVKPAAAKGIGSRYNIKAARIKEDISGPWIRDDVATLSFSRKAPTVTQFGFKPGVRGGSQPGLGRGRGWGKPQPAGKPGSATLLRGQRQLYPTTFMAPGRNGIMLPFRPGKGFTSTGRRKLETVYGPSIGSIFAGGSRYGDVIRAEVQARANEQFIRGFQRVLDSAARGYGS